MATLEEWCLTNNLSVASEWNYEKNSDTPNDISSFSNKKRWWQAMVSNRTKGSGCIYCSRQKALVGFSDLRTTHPELADEWNYEKNVEDITKIMAGSHKKVWWECKNGHEWQAIVYSRAAGSGCPVCEKLKPKS